MNAAHVHTGGLYTLVQTPDSPAHDGFVEKKSEFIADACHVNEFDEVVRFVEDTRTRHPKARHVAYAAIFGGLGEPQSERMSDDGEPSGTAGKPILDVLRANGLSEAVVTVTRYFAGVLLGSGGLIRAYSTAASLAVKAANVAPLIACRRYRVSFEYAQFATFDRVLPVLRGNRLNERFTDFVTCEVEIPFDQTTRFENLLRDMFNGQVKAEYLATVYRIELDG